MLLLAGLLFTTAARAQSWNFQDATIGELPRGWTANKTGEGPGSVWKVIEDATAPAGNKVLAQVSAEGPDALFNLCLANETKLLDLDLKLSLKPVAGKLDQGGGPVWRCQDKDNYYIARLNPLEGDFRLFHVVKGEPLLKTDATKPLANACGVIGVHRSPSRVPPPAPCSGHHRPQANGTVTPTQSVPQSPSGLAFLSLCPIRDGMAGHPALRRRSRAFYPSRS